MAAGIYRRMPSSSCREGIRVWDPSCLAKGRNCLKATPGTKATVWTQACSDGTYRWRRLASPSASTISTQRAAWIANLDKIAARKPVIVVPGHMTPEARTDLSGVDHTRAYLAAFEEE